MGVDKTPSISVVMTVYNSAKYLGQAIESILNQTFKDFEFVIIDDGSTDASLSIIQHYASLDPRCRYVSRENKGVIYSRNELLTLVRAGFIAHMDADDISLPSRLEKQYAYLQTNPQCVVVTNPVQLIDDEGLPICNFWSYTKHTEIDTLNLSGGGAVVCNPACMLRKSAIDQVGGFRAHIKSAEDLDLYLRLAEVGQIEGIPEVLFQYRQHLTSIGYAESKLQFEAMIMIVQEARQRRKMPPLEKAVALPDSSVKATYLKWGWWAYWDKHFRTSRKYGLKVLAAQPFNLGAIKLVVLSTLKQLLPI